MYRALSRGRSLPCVHRLPHYSGRGEAKKRIPLFPLLKLAVQLCLPTVLAVELGVSSTVYSLSSFLCPAHIVCP